MSFIRREITFVDYVRDRKEADIHLLIGSQQTGSGGQAYVLDYIGLQRFEGLNYSLGFVSRNTDTWAEEREGMGQILQAGLLPYVSQTAVGSQVSLQFNQNKTRVEVPRVDDRWNNWVFDIDGSGSFNIEAARTSVNVRGSISANRITEMWRIQNRLYGNYNDNRFESGEDIIYSTASSSGFYTTVVRSVSDHISAGLSGSLFASTYSNIDGGLSFGPALEYSYFPYSESIRREVTLAYRVGVRSVRYLEETVFAKLDETLMNESLSLRAVFQQPWGSVQTTVEGSHYFHDVTKNRVAFLSQLSLRVTRGLSLRMTGRADIIHDQLNLPRGEASLEDILLRQKQLATNFEYSGTIGIGYTFGSIYNNIVNTRL